MSATAPTTPDLTSFTVIHRVMRNDGRRFADAIARVTEENRAERVPPLARWYAGYMGELHDHHEIEDEIFYPALAARVPEAVPHVTRIDTDHEHLSDLIDRVAAVLSRLADPAVPFRTVHAEAMMVTDGLASLLESHLAFEDADVVPLFGIHFTGAEYDALEKKAMGKPSLRGLLFTLPWIMEGATDEERVQLLAGAPAPLKVIWYASRGRYRRLASKAFESFDVSAPEPTVVGV